MLTAGQRSDEHRIAAEIGKPTSGSGSPRRSRWCWAPTPRARDEPVLAGVIMWVPMSLAYLVPAALLTIRLLSPAPWEALRRRCVFRIVPRAGRQVQTMGHSILKETGGVVESVAPQSM
jgi:hypothetical protein